MYASRMTLHRAQILLEPDQHRELERRARDSQRSISELVRESVDEYLARHSEADAAARALSALDGLSALRSELQREHGTLDAGSLAALIDGVREERDEGLS
jgi:hypothetical protein